MKTRRYRYGTARFESFHRAVGHGYEVGLNFRGRPLFLGNFVHAPEAARYYALLNKQIRAFARRFPGISPTPPPWYRKMLADYIYSGYYAYLRPLIPAHGRMFRRALVTDMRKWRKQKRISVRRGAEPLYLRAA